MARVYFPKKFSIKVNKTHCIAIADYDTLCLRTSALPVSLEPQAYW